MRSDFLTGVLTAADGADKNDDAKNNKYGSDDDNHGSYNSENVSSDSRHHV